MHEASKFVEEVNTMKELIVEQMTYNEILNIDEKSLKAIQTAIRLVDAYGELTLKQAKEIEEINRKLDTLLFNVTTLLNNNWC